MRKENGHRKETHRADVARDARRTSGIVSDFEDGNGTSDSRQDECPIYGAYEMDVRKGESGAHVQCYTGAIDLTAARLDCIFRVMNKEVFGIRKAAKMVGGRMRLERLIMEGQIRAEKGNRTAQNGKWLINAADVLKFVRI